MGRKAIVRQKQLKCRSSRCGGRIVALGYCRLCYKRYREVLSRLQKVDPERAERLVAATRRQNFLKADQDILKIRVRQQLSQFETAPDPKPKPKQIQIQWTPRIF
jgi:hypothetical protein